jgi:hypothetical protein
MDNWSIVSSVTKPELHSFLKEWLASASKQEMRGLLLIQAIWKHKGHKKFKPRTQVSLPKLNRRRASTYQEEFAGLSAIQYKESHLNWKDVPACTVLTAPALAVLEQWATLDDDRYYSDLVLASLRGMAAASSCYSPPVTEKAAKFVWNSGLHKQKTLDSRKRSSSQTTMRPWVPQVKPAVPLLLESPTFKVQKYPWMKGNGNLLAWPGSTKAASLYQETFTSHFNRSRLSPVPRFASSVALTRMIPSPDLS